MYGGWGCSTLSPHSCVHPHSCIHSCDYWLGCWPQGEKSDSREELESLHNLMARLDFNGWFSHRTEARAAAAGGRLSVQF